jgi:para-aminobenzoate synthetase component 1
VNRKFISFPVTDYGKIKLQMLNWVNRFNICVFLDNHHYVSANHNVECLAASGSIATLRLPAGNALVQLELFHHEQNDWIFGHLAYDLKNEIESLRSTHPDGIGLPDIYFFVPETVLQLTEKNLLIGVNGNRHAIIFDEISNLSPDTLNKKSEAIQIAQRFSREEYLQTIRSIQQHIHAGDCYELNFCQEFYVDKVSIDPVYTYQQLSDSSPNPFSAFYKCDEKFVLCASPERYLQKKGRKILSQPIKGTRVRNAIKDPEDHEGRIELAASRKDRSENVMVVDLVRNDLAKVCEKGSVEVSELFGIYTFPQVHQMISTVTGIVRSDTGLAEMIRSTFPMGSMTGAPKKSVMELIERYERTRRGVFSGAIGYVTPEGDFDFNVVIRSLLYNNNTGYLSFQAGSAITFYSVAEEEYEECLIKIAAIKKVLAAANTF